MAKRITGTTPKQDGYRMPAEFEPQQGVWMLWPERNDNWRDGGKPAQKAFAEVVNRVLDSGYQVLALSTCTGIDSYNKDDRMVALNLRHLVNDPSRYHVVMDELNDLEMGKLLSACDLTVGTRLHSAIISMNFGTPAIAINYEHKSAGIMQQLGMPEMAVDIRHLLDGSLGAMVGDTLGQLPAINERLAIAVKAEREKGIGMVKSVLDRVREGK